AIAPYDNKVFFYDKVKDEWRMPQSQQELLFSQMDVIHNDFDHNIWFVKRRGLYLCKYANGIIDSITIPLHHIDSLESYETERISVICKDDDNRIWLGSGHGFLYRYDGSQWKSFSIKDTQSYLMSSPKIYYSYLDNADNLWINTYNFSVNAHNELIKINTSELKPQFYKCDNFKYPSFLDTSKQLIPRMLIFENIIEKNDGNLQTNMKNHLYDYDRSKNQWVHNERHRDRIRSLRYDPKLDYSYILDYDGILHTYKSDDFVSKQQLISDRDGDNHLSIFDFIISKSGKIWIAAEGAVYCFDSTSHIIYDASNSPIKRTPRSLFEDNQGRIWATTDEGITYYSEGKWTEFNKDNSPIYWLANDPADQKSNIVEDSKGNIYIQSMGKIYRWNGQLWQNYRNWNTVGNKIPRAGLFIDSQDNLWILNAAQGIYKCKENDCEIIIDNFQTSFQDIQEDKQGRIWIFTNHDGLFIYDPKG
ncbi:MAG: hypothetical protein MK212_18240, partial [Saprospiraceae bacterium]|nr:hypothetical protein [Saprospiraceae bacterium]